ncbi:LysR family transcriptional regulator [Pseudomonas sp. Ma2-10]
MNRMNIATVDLNLLKVFEALHEESSASRAALRLGVTQSAVSAALRRLREVYGDQLFVRTGRGLAPTLKANQLKPVVSDALNKCRQSLAMVDPAAHHYDGRSVTVGMSDDFEIAYGRRLIEEIARVAPKLRLIFRQTHSQIVARALMERSIDLAITAGGFAERLLSRQVLGLTRRVCASTTHFAALPHLLKGSHAVATIPAHAARSIAALSGLALLPCPLALPRYPIELGWRTSAQLDPVVLKVREAIVASFASTTWQPSGD